MRKPVPTQHNTIDGWSLGNSGSAEPASQAKEGRCCCCSDRHRNMAHADVMHAMHGYSPSLLPIGNAGTFCVPSSGPHAAAPCACQNIPPRRTALDTLS